MENVTPEDEDFPGRLLHQAALWDNAELLEDLLHGEQIAHINSQDSWGRTPLHAAATNDNSRCLGVLLQAGANPNTACGPRGENRTPLHLSAEHGYVSNVQLLLSHGADLMTRDNSGLTPLDISEKGDHVECMEILKQAAGRRSHDIRVRGGAVSTMSVVLEISYSGSSSLTSTVEPSTSDTTSVWETPPAEGGAAAAAATAAERIAFATRCTEKAAEGVLLAVAGTEIALSLAMAASTVAETAVGAAEHAAAAAEAATMAASAAGVAADAAKTAVWGNGATSAPSSSRVSQSASKSRSSKGSKRRSKKKPPGITIPCPPRVDVEGMPKEIVVANS